MRPLHLPVAALVAAALALLPGVASATTYHATPASLDTTFAAASGGDTILLANGTYDSWEGDTKSSTVTLSPEPGNTPSLSLNLTSDASHITFDGFTDLGGWLVNGADHITIRHSTFTAGIALYNGAHDLVLDDVTMDDLEPANWEGRLSLIDAHGVTIENSHFGGNAGCSDGIFLGGDSDDVLIQGNEFEGIQQGSCGAHSDPIQFYGSSDVTVDSNFFHDNSTGLMSPDGNGSPFTWTNNTMVGEEGGYAWAVVDGGGAGDVIRHNTIVGEWRIASTPSSESVDPDDVTVTDNVMADDVYLGTAPPLEVTRDYNLIPGGGAGAHTVNGSPTFSANGPGRCAYALSSGSAGRLAASDTLDIGITGCPADTTAPDTTIITGTSGSTTSTNASFSFSASEPGATFECKLDAGAYSACSSPKSYTAVTTGAHTFSVRAKDPAANVDATPATASWTVTGAFTTAPTFVAEHEVSSWTTTTSTKATSSFSVQAGDVLVAYGLTEDSSITESVSGGSLTWTLRQSDLTSGYGAAYVWTATATSSATITVTFTRTAGSNRYGGNVLQFRNSTGVGAASATHNSGAPSLGLTTTEAHSAVVVASVDWNAVSGASRTWRTGAGALTEQTYFLASGQYTGYGGFHADAGAAGAKTVGLSAPSGQAYATVAVEVKGS
jgi:Right handed beta helix region